MESYADSFDAIVSNDEQVIQGKHDAILFALLCMVAECHLLTADVHGSGSAVDDLEPVADAADVEKMIAMAQAIHVAPVLKSYIVDLAAATRGHQGLALGMSPRASLSLQRAARAQAASAGREYVVPDDIKQLAIPVYGIRMVLTLES